jgi:hypothetical protein
VQWGKASRSWGELLAAYERSANEFLTTLIGSQNQTSPHNRRQPRTQNPRRRSANLQNLTRTTDDNPSGEEDKGKDKGGENKGNGKGKGHGKS